MPLGDNRFVLTSNRDENHSRNTSSLELRLIGKEKVLFPVDPVSGGSWIAISQSNRLACILNGAFVKHRHRPPYKRSRGLILLDYFTKSDVSQFRQQYHFEGIEPFTMIIFERDLLVAFRWDGVHKHTETLSLKVPHIWSSSTLYDRNARMTREDWFRQWCQENRNPVANDLLQFHRHGGTQDTTNGLVMNRDNKVQTLSITGIDKGESSAVLHHHDLIKNTTKKRFVDFSRNEILESY